MPAALTPLEQSRQHALHHSNGVQDQIEQALGKANSNKGRNVYLSADHESTLREAALLDQAAPQKRSSLLLFGTPVSIKDCFDLKGFPTSCGSKAWAAEHGLAHADSWVARKLRAQGAVLTGKTHLHQLAYGITGENSEYGDCCQPRDAQQLTGGSSSGAAGSVQEGSAIAAIGTDTGGSIRVPASLCGLAGYRSSLGLGDWEGGAHLALSFDTIGWLFRDLRDGPMLAHALFDLPLKSFAPTEAANIRIASVSADFLHDCEPSVSDAFARFQQILRDRGMSMQDIDTTAWSDSFEVFSAIQASEAAAIHTGPYERFEIAIAERLSWGASLTPHHVQMLHERHRKFRDEFDKLFETFDFLLLPCAPVSSLQIGKDHSFARKRILRYTTPASLAGAPVVAVPLPGAGAQLVGAHGADASLLAFAAWLGSFMLPA